METDLRTAFHQLMSERGWGEELKEKASAAYERFIETLQPWPHIISELKVGWRDEEEDILLKYTDERLFFGAAFFEDGFTLSYEILDGKGETIVSGWGSDPFFLTSPMFEDFADYLRGDYSHVASAANPV